MFKLKVIDGETYLLDVDMTRMAKDLPKGTIVLCIGEIPHEGACIRKSGKEDHCYGCQPLIASTKDIDGVGKLEITNYDKTNIQEFCWSTDRFVERIDTLHQQLVEEIKQIIKYDNIQDIRFIKAISYNKEPTDFRFGNKHTYVWGLYTDESSIRRFVVSSDLDVKQVSLEIDALSIEQLIRVIKRLEKKSYKQVEWKMN